MALGKLTINDRNDGFLLDGRPWFWVGDTCWSAFTNITLDDFEYYLRRRVEQGINVLQVNTLPQWDRCRPDLGIYPYASEDGAIFDFASVNDAYWERARTMCRMMVEHGVRPALVLSWCNFVPGTWGSRIAKITGAPTMPIEDMVAHVRRVVDRLGEFDPVYVVSGDTDFKTPEAIDYYDQVLQTICDAAPDAVRTMHINRGNRDIPLQYVDRLDFYMFQPGHNYEEQFNAWTLPEDIAAKFPKKPMINSEPCYEQMGASRNVYWRFSAKDCRASAWSSILAGAVAGVTYGAHGIWNWQTATSEGSALGEGFDAPFRWQEAIQFPGVWDYGMIPDLLSGLTDGSTEELVPAQGLLDDTRDSIRVARAGKRVVAYLPFATKVRLRDVPGDSFTARALNLADRRIARLDVTVADGVLSVAQHPFADDVLVVVEPA